MKRKLLLLILPVITVILETLPVGVKMCFMAPNPQECFIEYYSYFDTFPIGYAMICPFLTAVLSCVILFLIVVFCFWKKSGLVTVIKTLLYIASILSICPIIVGIKYFTIIGGLVTLSLIIELILLYVIKE